MSESWHALPPEEVLGRLDSGALGLSSEEARARLARHGPNEFVREKRTSPIRVFLKQFANLLLAILLAATVVSAALGEWIDAIVIGIIVVFVVVLGFAQEYRAERALEALKRMLSPTCTVVRDGNAKEVPVKDLVPGDVVLLEAGDRVPADMRVLESVNLQIDEASLTGESFPVAKTVAPLLPTTPLPDRTNLAFSGTVVTYGKGKSVVVATGMATEFGKIAKELAEVEPERTPLERRMDEIGRKLGLLVLGVILVVIAVELAEEYFLGGGVRFAFFVGVLLFGIALAVAVVPEALPAIVTGTLAIGMHIMAKRNALVRRMPAVETLGSTQIICSDKTGTLTKGEMTARDVYVAGRRIQVTGAGYEPRGEVLADGRPAEDGLRREVERLGRAALLCSDATLEQQDGAWIVHGDPTEGALVVLAEKVGLRRDEVPRQSRRIAEVPFSSERKRMTTVHEVGNGAPVAYMKGAPEVVLERCTHVREVGGPRSLTESDRRRILETNDAMARVGLRVLAVAERGLPVDADLAAGERLEEAFTLLGLVGMIDPPRPEAQEAVQVALRVGMKPIMITGDHKLTALEIAKEMGIYHEGDLILTGTQLDSLGDGEFESMVDKVTVYARVSPAHKLRIVRAWQANGRVVAMTGDGVNDAPALKRSDIGIAMGITGTDVTKETADIVLADDNFASIVRAIELGRWIYDNIKKYLAYLLQANLVEIAVLSIGALFVLRFFGYEGESALPLLAVHILYINLATDGLPALALGFAPPDPDLMERPPRPPNEPVFSRDVKAFLLLAVLVQTPVLTLAFISGLQDGIDAARTRLFLMLVFVELALALNCRSLTFTILRARPHKWLMVTVAWETALIVALLHIPGARAALHILYPTVEDVLWIAAGVVITFVSIELLKHYLPHRREPAPVVAPAVSASPDPEGVG
ncbi:MAG: cation-translocating P-type ATPase [Euryarchaeota archaeon]|nr:cation-translocating P-type ATPase [Euryarchaeota archaeon]